MISFFVSTRVCVPIVDTESKNSRFIFHTCIFEIYVGWFDAIQKNWRYRKMGRVSSISVRVAVRFNLIYFIIETQNVRIIIPPSLREEVVSALHAAHQGVTSMISRAVISLLVRYYFCYQSTKSWMQSL